MYLMTKFTVMPYYVTITKQHNYVCRVQVHASNQNDKSILCHILFTPRKRKNVIKWRRLARVHILCVQEGAKGSTGDGVGGSGWWWWRSGVTMRGENSK